MWDRTLLLALDNFEQVLPAGEFVQQLLDDSTQLRILVTSRSPLHLSGEQEYPVPTLRMPARGPALRLVRSRHLSRRSCSPYAPPRGCRVRHRGPER